MKSVITSLFALVVLSNVNLINAQNCIDSSLINPDAACFEIYMPVCGCDGITYSNSCYATIMGGVTSYTDGPCAGGVIDSEPSSDLAGVDFGVCAMYMGITIINGACVGISGCGWIVNGINYQTASYNSLEECQACLESIPIDAEPCTDVADVEFGDCDMALGITIINGQCAFVSGCGFVVDDINYAPAFYNTIEACEACFKTKPTDAEPCTDLANIDFGPCSMFIGYALNGGQCIPMSGCGTVANNVNYQNALYATEAECELCLSTNSVIDNVAGHVVIYPNPAQDVLHIQSDVEINRIIIYNSAGNLIFESNTTGQEFSLDIRNWSSGLYIIQIQNINGLITSKVLLD